MPFELKMNDSLWSRVSPSGSSRVRLTVVSLLASFGLPSQKPPMTQLELCEAKNGTAAILKKTRVCLIVSDSHVSRLGTEGKEGSCGGVIWYEFKLFPNRLQKVWSCSLPVCYITPLSQSTSFTPHWPPFPSWQNALKDCSVIFSMTLWFKVPPRCCLWLVEFSHALLDAWISADPSVSFFVGNQPQVLGHMEILNTARGNDWAFCYMWHEKWSDVCIQSLV